MRNFKPIFLLTISVLILEGCDKKDPKEHLQKGIEYFNKGEYEKAVLELKTSSQSDKKLAETYYYLALLDEKNRQYKAMSENLKKVIEISPTHLEARLKFGRVQLLLGQLDSALEQAETILKNSNHNPDAQLLKASVLMKQTRQAEAQAIVDSVLKENPKHIDGLMLKSVLYMENKNSDSALSAINTAIKYEPKNISLRLFKIQINAQRKNIDSVINDYQELASLFPENQDFEIILAKIYTQSGKKKEAEDLLKNLIDKKPDDINLKLLFLDFLKTAYPEKAHVQFQKYTEEYKEKSGRLLALGKWAVAQQNFDDAKSVFHHIVELDQDKNQILSAKIYLGQIAYALKDFVSTKKILEDILAENSNYIDAKILQARILLAENKHDEAVDVLTKVLWDQPNSEETLVLLGQSFFAKGDEKEAEKQFKKVLEINPANQEAFTYLYNNALSDRKLGYAEEISEKALRYHPDNLFLLEKIGRVYISEKKWDSANDILKKIEGFNHLQATSLAKFLQAKIYQGQGECIKAIDLYKDLAELVAESYEILGDLALCYEKINKKDSMIVFLNDLLSKNSRNITASIILSDLLANNKQFEKSESLLRNLINENSKIPELYAELAKVKLAKGDSDSAINDYKEGLKANPGNINLLLSMAALYEKQGDYDAAVSIYEILLKNNPDLDIATNNLASILIEHGNDKEDLTKAVKLSEKFKDSKQASYKDTYAWALINQGNPSSGIELLNQIIISDPDVPVFRYHLAVAHHKNADNGSALSELREALNLAAKRGDFSDKKAAEALLNEIIAKNNQ
ncbi:tetratricopeptide repeat protein [Methylomicrobium sp. RS1]|uniref:tetratricopeptide repeat protein n=1 Tax=Candidatus Methylomicrobium oryzae TaxID=2802053 RepID=UPI0019232648|nr:tetratricopeptide repeat protein [Methylomicrobium sp. RS1]MBL1264965.1 tetratricopeptide repeat protein [Methylomicrobium sp. RS1]